MYKDKKVTALIAAAGTGERMGSSKPKQFLKIGNKTLLEKAAEAFENSASVDDIYIIAGEAYIENLKDDFLENHRFHKIAGVIAGGDSRQRSVGNGLYLLKKNNYGHSDIVLVHDGARPYISVELIDNIISAARKHKAVVPATPVKDTIKVTDNNIIKNTPDRQTLYAAQTPQCFEFQLLYKAYQQAEDDNFTGTDDSQLVERLGETVRIIEGEDNNIKITTSSDMPSAKESEECRVGIGFDVHAFSPDRNLILGGIEIPYSMGLLGHSDADVLTHALMDSILGALNLGDIGTNFPDTDMTYKDISSIILLEKVADLMKKNGYTLGNADLVIVAEKPKMKEHIPAMSRKLADILNVEPNKISIKATTTEGLGFTGREEGIGAQAIVKLNKDTAG